MKLPTIKTKINRIQIPSEWRILITGITSIHGWPIFSRLYSLVQPSHLFGIRPPKMNNPQYKNVLSLCITDHSRLKKIRTQFQPTHVIHCAGVCDLDVCEERPEWAHSINVEGTKIITDLFGNNTTLFYMSTDLVFSGHEPPQGGYRENCQPDPISIAGKTFTKAETYIKKCKSHCILRLGLPLGNSLTGDKGAIDWIESRFKKNLPVTLFYDEYRSCISCEDMSILVLKALTLELRGLYHLGGDKSWSLYDIGKYVLLKGKYPKRLLKGMCRHEEKNGPPRISDVSLNSKKIKNEIVNTK